MVPGHFSASGCEISGTSDVVTRALSPLREASSRKKCGLIRKKKQITKLQGGKEGRKISPVNALKWLCKIATTIKKYKARRLSPSSARLKDNSLADARYYVCSSSGGKSSVLLRFAGGKAGQQTAGFGPGTGGAAGVSWPHGSPCSPAVVSVEDKRK